MHTSLTGLKFCKYGERYMMKKWSTNYIEIQKRTLVITDRVRPMLTLWLILLHTVATNGFYFTRSALGTGSSQWTYGLHAYNRDYPRLFVIYISVIRYIQNNMVINPNLTERMLHIFTIVHQFRNLSPDDM